MEFLDLAKRRASVRAYQKRSVERDVLEQVLEAGRVAPTACNRQPVHLLVAHTPESMAKVCSARQSARRHSGHRGVRPRAIKPGCARTTASTPPTPTRPSSPTT